MEENKFFDQDLDKEEIESYRLFPLLAGLAVDTILLQAYGPEKAIFISNLINKFSYLKDKGESNSKGHFSYLINQQVKDTGLAKSIILQSKQFFLDLGIIETKSTWDSLEQYKINMGFT